MIWSTFCRVLQQAEVPASKVYIAADIHQDPHFRARDMIQQPVLPDGQPIYCAEIIGDTGTAQLGLP